YANRISHHLSHLGIDTGSIVGLYMKPNIHILATIIAIFKTGAAYLPIDAAFPEERVKYILQNSGMSLLVTGKETTQREKEIADPKQDIIFQIETETGETNLPEQKKYATENRDEESDPQNLAYIIYTSGTTGTPKGVMIHQQGMINHIYAKINDLAITAEDIVAQTASISFDISVWQFLAGLLKGATTLIIDKDIVYDPEYFLKVLQKEKVTILESVPSLMTAFLEINARRSDKELHSLRWMIPTGEPLSVSLAREWFKNYPAIRLVNAYGPTEASDDVTHYIIEKMPREDLRTIPVGKPLQNLHIYILDSNLTLCPAGVRGEICVAGIGVGKGYWQDPEKTAKAFVPNPYVNETGTDYATLYRTGDIGYYTRDGNVECLGRLDNQVKIRGNRIELGEIESRILINEKIKETVVEVIEEAKGINALCAYIVADEKMAPDEIITQLAHHLPEYMVPTYYMQLEKIPLTANGKANRKALPKPKTRDAAENLTLPRDQMEKKLARIWAEVIDTETAHIGIDSDFFRMGGHSLKAILMASRIHKTFNVKMELARIFENPTIREMAGYIKNAETHRFTAIEPIEKKEYYPLSSAQRSIYIQQQKLGDNLGYNLSQVFMLKGNIQKEKVDRTFKTLIARHESLRTAFRVIKGEPVQF
ncbi:MAG: amino acid adenylation domain-containing protein, partial [bacterium]|nr:amino acid adenylation domain-containing protein [bacterium]